MTGGPEPLDRAFASPQAKQRYARRLFATIADRYDLITVLLSFGLDRRWKRRVVDLAAPVPVIARWTWHRAQVISPSLWPRAAPSRWGWTSPIGCCSWRAARPPAALRRSPAFVTGDMCALPFPAEHFDIVTTGYGLRNVPDLPLAVAEISRVLRPGGTLVSLDFNRPENALVRGVYLGYLWAVGGALGWILHRDPDTYRYIPASIRRYPGAAKVAELMRAEGFSHAEWIPVLGGLMAIHVARK